MDNHNNEPDDNEDLAELAIRMGGKPDPELARLQLAADFNDDIPTPGMVIA